MTSAGFGWIRWVRPDEPKHASAFFLPYGTFRRKSSSFFAHTTSIATLVFWGLGRDGFCV